jgi:hypothetical protein
LGENPVRFGGRPWRCRVDLHCEHRTGSEAHESFWQPFEQSVKYSGSPACRYHDQTGLQHAREIGDYPGSGPEMKFAPAMWVQNQRLFLELCKFASRLFGVLLKQFRRVVPTSHAAWQGFDYMDQYDFGKVLAGKRDGIFKRGQRVGRKIGGKQNPSYVFIHLNCAP